MARAEMTEQSRLQEAISIARDRGLGGYFRGSTLKDIMVRQSGSALTGSAIKTELENNNWHCVVNMNFGFYRLADIKNNPGLCDGCSQNSNGENKCVIAKQKV